MGRWSSRKALVSHRADAAGGIPTVVWAVLVFLIVSMYFPWLPFVSVAGACVILSMLLVYIVVRLVPKAAREAAGHDGLFASWSPTALQSLRLVWKTLTLWVPFGLVSVALFGVNAFLVQLLEEATTRGLTEMGHLMPGKVAFEVSWPFTWIPGVVEASQSMSESMGEGLNTANRALVSALWLAKFLFLIEGMLGIACFAWLTLRSITCIYFRLAMGHGGARVCARFDMGLLK